MPTPGNAELVVYILATIVVGIVALPSDDRVNWPEFVTAFTFFTFAYLISRGIAKASRVDGARSRRRSNAQLPLDTALTRPTSNWSFAASRGIAVG